jgi:methylenetetrahydrofolate reductase (NADPH)
VRCGTAFLITQLFFDNADYFGYVERARAPASDVPITPGIMPITNVGRSSASPRCAARASPRSCSSA